MNKTASLRRRIIIALIFVLVLGGVAPTVVFYSLGYRFDWNKKIFVHSGSIVIKSTPLNVNVSLDGKQVSGKSIDYINQTTNINGLTPKKYLLEVSAPGYKSWKKETEVHSGIATEYWNVLLAPENIAKTNLLSGNILVYALSPDNKSVAYFTKQDEWVNLFVRDKNGKENFVYKESVNQRYVPQEGELKWSGDGKWLIFSLKQNNEEKVFLVSSDDEYKTIVQIGELWKNTLLKSNILPSNASASNINSNNNNTNNKNKKNLANNLTNNQVTQKEQPLLDEGIKATYSWDKKDNIYFLYNGSIYVQSATTVYNWWIDEQNKAVNENINKAVSGNNNRKLSFSSNQNINKTFFEEEKVSEDRVISNEEPAYPKKIRDDLGGYTFCDNYICEVNLKEKNLEFINDSGSFDHRILFPEGYETNGNYKIFAYGSDRLAVLDDKENLFVWDEKEPALEGKKDLMEFIKEGVKEVYFSDDGKKLLFATDKEAYVYFLREWEVQPKHAVGDLVLIWKQDPEMVRVAWYLDYQHIFVVNKDAVKLVDLDERGGQNVYDFFLGDNISGFDYSTGERKIRFREGAQEGPNKVEEISFPPSTGFISNIIGGQSNNVNK